MNLANMLMARGANRRRELAIRLAVGASRFRLLRQMISEGILLSLLGGLAGLALAYGLSVLNAQFHPPTGAPSEPDITLDWRAGVFAFGLAFVCGIGFSLAPALQATNRRDAGAQRGLGGAIARLPAFRPAQLADSCPGYGIADAAADYRISGNRTQQGKQYRKPNSIRVPCRCCPSIRCAMAIRQKKR